MLYDAEKRLVELLLSESEILIHKTHRKVNEIIISIYDSNLEEKQDELYKRHSKYQQQLEERRQRKWEATTYLKKVNKVVNFPRKDTSKPVTEYKFFASRI